jgi:hypothetical protein
MVAFKKWEAQLLPDTLGDLINAYENGFAGALSAPDEEAALRDDCKRLFGCEDAAELAHANGWADSGAGKLVLPYLHAEKRWPGCFPGTRQFVGSCVSHSQTKCNLVTLACELAAGLPDPDTGKLEGPPEVPAAGILTGVLHPSPLYWTRGYNGHGWSCATAARRCVDRVGAVVCKPYELGIDLTEITKQHETMYGAQQPPEEWREVFGSHIVRAVAEVRGFEALRDALFNGYGVSSCGSEGYSSKRNEHGVSRRTTNWAHAMAILGVDDREIIKAIYGGPLVLIQNSWAKWNSGPRRIHGTSLDIPEGAFWTPWSDCQKRYYVMVNNFRGFPPRTLPDWGTYSFAA